MNIYEAFKLRDGDRVKHHDTDSGHDPIEGVIVNQKNRSQTFKTPAEFDIEWDDDNEPPDNVILGTARSKNVDSDSEFLVKHLEKI